MTVQSNLLMLRLAQARMSCPSYPAYWEKRTALTPTLSPIPDHHKSSASNLAWPSRSQLSNPGSRGFCTAQPLFPRRSSCFVPRPPSWGAPVDCLVLHSTLRNLAFSPSLSCLPSFLRDWPVLVGIVEGILSACACTQLFLPFPWSGCLLLRLSPPAPATISNSSLGCHFPSQLLPAPYVLLTLLFPVLETPCKCQTGISRHYVLH